MQTTNKAGHKRNVIIGSLLALMSVICIIMTIIFIYVSNHDLPPVFDTTFS